MSRVYRVFRVLLIGCIMAFAIGLSSHVHADAPQARYVVANGTVFDTKTGLLWQQVVPSPTRTWSDAKTYCNGLDLDGKTVWRLPSMKELQTIVDESRINPAIDVKSLPSTPSGYFWTSSPWAVNPSSAWIVYFSGGDSFHDAVSSTSWVRCVR